MNLLKFNNIIVSEKKDIITNFKLNRIATEGRLMSVNEKFFAFSWEKVGHIAIFDCSKHLEINSNFHCIKGPQSNILDLEFSSFNNNILCSGHSDGSVILWKIPENGLNEDLKKENLIYKEHSKGVSFINFNPSAKDIICSGELYGKIHIWNAEKGIKYNEYYTNAFPSSIQWNPKGNLIGVSTKKQMMNIYDPRTNQNIFVQKISESYINPKFAWTDDNTFVAFNYELNKKKLFLKLWDIRKLEKNNKNDEDISKQIKESIPIVKQVYIPFVDRESKLIYLTLQDDSSIDIYDYSDGKLIKNTCFSCSQPSSNSILFNRKNLDKDKLEIDRLVRYYNTNKTISYISFNLPKKTNNLDYILYPSAESKENILSYEQWINGEDPNKNNEIQEKISNRNICINNNEIKIINILPNNSQENNLTNTIQHQRNQDKAIKDVENKIIEIENKYNEIEQKYQIELNKNQEMENNLKSINNEKEEINKKYNNLNKNYTELQNINKELENKYIEVKQKNDDLINDNKVLEKNLLELKNNFNEINQKYNEEIKKDKDINEKFQKLNDSYTLLSSKNKELENNFNNLSKKYDEDTEFKFREINDLKGNINEIQNENMKLKEVIKEKDLKINEYEELNKNLKKELEKFNEIENNIKIELEQKYKSDLQCQNKKIKDEEEIKIKIFKKEFEKSLNQKYASLLNSEISKIQRALNSNIEQELKIKDDEFKFLYIQKEKNREKNFKAITEKLKMKSNEIKNSLSLSECKALHYGIKCQKCFQDPIIGYRYKCNTCNNYNLCEKCENENLISEDHPHFFIKMRRDIDFQQNKNEENKIKKEDYLCECLNNNLKLEILEGTKEQKLEIVLKNNGSKPWLKNVTKLLINRETTLSSFEEEIKLQPQNPDDINKYDILLKKLDENEVGEYKLNYDFIINDELYVNQVQIKIIIKGKNENNELNKYKEKIKEFRNNFSLSVDDYSDEKLLEILKKNGFNFEISFDSLFQ